MQVLERPEEGAEKGDDDEESDDNDGSTQSKIILRQQKGWSLLESLSSTPSVAKQLVETYGWLELLGIIAGYAKFTKTWAARQGAAKAMSRLLWDPQTSAVAGESDQIGRRLPVVLLLFLSLLFHHERHCR